MVWKAERNSCPNPWVAWDRSFVWPSSEVREGVRVVEKMIIMVRKRETFDQGVVVIMVEREREREMEKLNDMERRWWGRLRERRLMKAYGWEAVMKPLTKAAIKIRSFSRLWSLLTFRSADMTETWVALNVKLWPCVAGKGWIMDVA